MGFIDGLNLNAPDIGDAWDGESGFNPPAQGDYVFRVTEAEQSKSSKGNQMLVTTLEVVSAAEGQETDQAGKTMKDWRTWHTQGGARRLKSLVLASGIEPDKSGSFDTDDLVGREFVATVVVETRPVSNPDGTTTEYDNARIYKERRVRA